MKMINGISVLTVQNVAGEIAFYQKKMGLFIAYYNDCFAR